MSKHLLRTSLQVLIAIGVAIAILVAVVSLTPFGGRTAVSVAWSMAAGDSGVALSIGSTNGSLARGIIFHDVALTTRDGTRLFEADLVEASLGAVSPGAKRVELAGVRIDGAEMLFETGADGELVGWSKLGRGRADPPQGGAERDRWDVRFDLAMSDATFRVRNEASGLAMVVGPVDGTAAGALVEFDADLAGALTFSLPALDEPVAGDFEGLATLADNRLLRLDSLALRTNAGDALATGTVWLRAAAADSAASRPDGGAPAGPSANLTIESTHDLSRLAALFGASDASGGPEGLSGSLTLSSEMRGPFVAPDYSSLLRAENVTFGAADVELVTASLSGDAAMLEAKSFHLEAMGGSVDGSAAVEFPDAGGARAFPRLRGRAEFAALALDRLASLAPGSAARVSGVVGGTATIDWTSPGLSRLNASFDLATSRLVAAERELGSASVMGRLADGLLLSSGSCCGASLTGMGVVTDAGLEGLSVSLASDDLSVLGSALGVAELAGSGTAELALSAAGSSPSLSGTVALPDLQVPRVAGRPGSGRSVRTGRLLRPLFTRRSTRRLLGTASLERRRRLQRVRRRALVRPCGGGRGLPARGDVTRGRALGSGVCQGEVGGVYAVTGEIAELDLAVRRQSAALTAPFSFAGVSRLGQPDRGIAHRHVRRGVRCRQLPAADALDMVLSFSGSRTLRARRTPARAPSTSLRAGRSPATYGWPEPGRLRTSPPTSLCGTSRCPASRWTPPRSTRSAIRRTSCSR